MRSKQTIIDEQAKTLLNLRRLPAVIDFSQVAVLTGFGAHYVSMFVALGLLKPLGEKSLRQNSRKLFSTEEIEMLCKDRSWLDRCTRAILNFNQQRNSKEEAFNIERESGDTVLEAKISCEERV